MSAFGLDLDSIRFGRQARPGERVDSGLSAFRRSEASDTGQNTSPVQNAFRSLHYVAVTLAYSVTISLPCLTFWGQTPCRVGPGPEKTSFLRGELLNI